MSVARRSRSVRPAKRGIRVTARDLEILQGIGRMGAATTDQVRRLWFGDPSTAVRRLARLTAVHLLDVHVGRRDEPNVYVLGRRGVDVLLHEDVDEASLHRSKATRGIDPHLRALNDLRVELVLAERRGLLNVRAFHGDLDLRRSVAGTMPSYLPDAIVELGVGDEDVLALFAEIDLGTESAATFAGKVRVTVEASVPDQSLWGFETGAWMPIVLAPTPGRVRALARAIVGAGGADLWLAAQLDVVRERGIAGAVFARPLDVVETARGVPLPYCWRLPRRSDQERP